jgi:hypothetical protein
MQMSLMTLLPALPLLQIDDEGGSKMSMLSPCSKLMVKAKLRMSVLMMVIPFFQIDGEGDVSDVKADGEAPR